MPHRHCGGAVAHAIFRSRSPVSFQIHAPRRSTSAPRNSHPLPSSSCGPCSAGKDRPASFRDADWSSVGMLSPADADRDARFLVFTGRTGRWKGIFAVHSWVVFKPENATSWSRYDVVGWGQPVRTNGWAPDG